MSITGGDGGEVKGSFRFFGEQNPEEGFGKLTPKQEESVGKDKAQINKAEEGVGVSKADVMGVKAQSGLSQNILNKFAVETLKNTTSVARNESLSDSHEVTSTIDKILSKAEKVNIKQLEKERKSLSKDYEKLEVEADKSISSMSKATLALQASSAKLDSFKGAVDKGRANFLFGVSKGDRVRKAEAKAAEAAKIDSGFKPGVEKLSLKEDQLMKRAENLGDAQIELKTNIDTRVQTVKDIHAEITTAKDMHQKLTDIRNTKFKILDSNKRVVKSSAKDEIKNELVILGKKIETLEKLLKEVGKVEIDAGESKFIGDKKKELEGLKNDVKESVEKTKGFADTINIEKNSDIPEGSPIREMSFVEKIGSKFREIIGGSIDNKINEDSRVINQYIMRFSPPEDLPPDLPFDTTFPPEDLPPDLPFDTIFPPNADEESATSISRSDENSNVSAEVDQTTDPQASLVRPGQNEFVKNKKNERSVLKEAEGKQELKMFNLLNEMQNTELTASRGAGEVQKMLTEMVKIKDSAPFQRGALFIHRRNYERAEKAMKNLSEKINEINKNPETNQLEKSSLLAKLYKSDFKEYSENIRPCMTNYKQLMQDVKSIGENATFGNFAITTIQRLPRHELLIKEMIKEIPEDSPVHQELRLVLEGIKEIMSEINSQI